MRLFRTGDAAGESIVVRTFEMGEGGMSVYATETFPIGTGLVAEVTLPGGKPMRLPCIVRNVRGFRCGMEFTGADEAQRAEIMCYLNTVAEIIEI